VTEFESILAEKAPQLTSEQRGKWVQYRDLVLAESERQNLTKLLDPLAFFYGHVWDCLELLRSAHAGYPAMDLGSGVGIPGIGMSILGTGPWVLAESEGHKARFLEDVVRELGLANVSVHAGRADAYLKSARVETIVARAAGKVGKLMESLGTCSTWNTLVLLKGPSWDEEWAEFLMTRWRKALTVQAQHEYSAPTPEGNFRSLRVVKLTRVPA
jgi:16S rRNA (guanine527-N7)-methyltransferase